MAIRSACSTAAAPSDANRKWGSSTGTTLSDAAAANVKSFVRRTVLLNGDFADAVGQDGEVEQMISNSVKWAGETHHGYVGEFNGAFAGLTG